MSALLDRRVHAEMTTADVSAREAFAYWRDMICATFVQLDALPVADTPFTGRIEHVPAGEMELSTVQAASQHVRRTRSLLARSSEEYLLASIQVRGQGCVEQDGRTAVLSVGDMAFYDSTRPYTLHFDDLFHQLVVQIPKGKLQLRDTRSLTVRSLGRDGPAGVAATFFTSLQRVLKTDPKHASALLPHAVGLLSATASIADGARLNADATHALLHERVMEFLRRHLDDGRLNGARVAAACGVSRRTLYRIFGEGGVAAQLRRMRMDRAKAMLIETPDRPVGQVGMACGFDSESGFYRAFRAATGQTPGEYRAEGTGTHGTLSQ